MNICIYIYLQSHPEINSIWNLPTSITTTELSWINPSSTPPGCRLLSAGRLRHSRELSWLDPQGFRKRNLQGWEAPQVVPQFVSVKSW